MGKKIYKPIDWGMQSHEMSELEIMRAVPDEIIQYYFSHYKNKGIPLNLQTAMEIRDILRRENEKVV